MYNGFLFQGLTLGKVLMGCVVTGVLIGANELARRNKWVALMLFAVLPVVLTFALWLPVTATPGTGASTGTWFHWVKVYSALVGCLGFMLIRFWPNRSGTQPGVPKWLLLFPPLILAANILEACIRDFQVYSWHVSGLVVDGVVMMSGPWNLMNGVAGLLNILTITGWWGIYVSKDRNRDMIWPGMTWFWIIAYDLWNFAYVYNCVSDHSFYAGAALLLSCTIPAFFIKKGAWLQHRAQTLALWMMFTMSVPSFVQQSAWSVQATHSPAALTVVSLVSLVANVMVFIYHYGRMLSRKRKPVVN